MSAIFVDRLLREMAKLKGKNRNLSSEMNHRIQTLELELSFLKMFIWFLPRRSRKKDYIRATVGNGKLGLYGDHPDRALELAISKLLQKIELCKPEIRDDCLNLIDLSSFQRKFSSSNDELLRFINYSINNLKNLVSLKAGAGDGAFAVVSGSGRRKQIRELIKNLRMFRDFVKSTGERWFFTIDVQEYVYKTTYLSILYWVEQIDELMAARMKTIITDLRQMVRSYFPEITGLYIRALKVSKFMLSDNSEIGETAVSFVDFILPIGFMKILRHELIFLVAFVINPGSPVKDTDSINWDLVVAKAKAVAAEIPSLIFSLTAGDMKQEIITKERVNLLLGDFKRKIHEVMEEVRKLHFHLPKSSGSCFPATNPLGFFDSLLENFGKLKDTLMGKAKFLSFARDLILTLHRELVLLRHSLTQTHGVPDEFEELKDLWLKITNAAYRADYVIDSCQILHLPIWHNVLSLSDVIEEIKFTREQIEKIMINQIYTSSRIMNSTVDSISSSSSSSHPLRLDEEVVGFKDEEEEITRRLTRGTMELEVVSIVGMPGQGKSTLAKKIYNSPTVRKHFTKSAWCFVTQIYNVSNLLSDIFRDIDNGSHHLMKYGLPEKVRKCLSGERYLIIMDDIWDITVWNAIKESFPDNNNGSRVLFTSRNSNLGCNRNPHLLRPFSVEESTELLKQKLSNYNYWRSYDDSNYSFKQILNVCNGLPLAIVAVAGLLTMVSSDWELFQLVRNLTSNLANEGCMDILELSYKSLPSYLKPCFLYLGALGQQTNVFKVQKLIHLWIAEGFVQKSGTKSLEELAMEYLEDLVSRNLIIINKRSSSNGEIKQCRIHDLMHELCLRKAEEERFIHFPNSAPPINHDQYRICIYNSWILGSISDEEPPPAGTNIRSLLLPLNNYRNVYPYSSLSTFFICLKFVRVLDLASLDSHHCFPEEILLLICLRYISIKCDVQAIPLSIGNLHKLEFLHLLRRTTREGSRIQFPHTIWKLKQLKNVDLGPGANIMLLDNDDDYDDELCNLDSFSSLRPCNLEDAENILRRFPNIRKLRLELSESWSCRRNCYQFKALNSLSKLESLTMEYPREVIHSCCAFNFPTAIGSLTLSRFFHPWREISNIGKLPNLKVLKLLNSAFVGERWDVEDDAFLKLKYLKLSQLGLLYWEASTSSFPCLERLVLRSCYFLKELPSSFGEILTLKTIEARFCHNLLGISAEGILSEQIEQGNEDLKLLMSNAPGSINYNQ